MRNEPILPISTYSCNSRPKRATDRPAQIAHTEEAPALDLLTPAEVWTAREETAKASGAGPADAEHPMPTVQRLAMFVSVVGPLAGMVVAIVLLWGRGVGPVDLAAMALMYCIAGF